MKVDLKLVDGKLLFPTTIIQGGLAINNGKIVAVGKESALPESNRTIDLKGKLLMPGVIDAHVHLSTSSKRNGEDITSGTAVASVGGVTFTGIMPQIEVLTKNRDTLQKNKERCIGKSYIDFNLLGGFSGGEGNDFSKDIPELWEEGVIAIKGYMHNHRPHRKLKASYDGEMLWAL